MRFGPTRRGGPLFRWLGEPAAVDLANTVMVVRDGEAVDLLAEDGGFEGWLSAERNRLGEIEVDPVADLPRVLAFRDSLRELLTARSEGRGLPRAALAAINEASARAPHSPTLAIGPGGEPLVESRPSGGVDELLGLVARSAIELLATIPAEEVRVCRAPSCGMFYLGSRRWCCSACGNRARAARHYRRRREGRRRPSVDPGAQ